MNPKLIIISTDHFFDYVTKKISIGGVQTYILDLATLSKKLGYHVEFWIRGNVDYIDTPHPYAFTFIGVKSKNPQLVFDKALKTLSSPLDKIIIDTDQQDIVSTDARIIQIQHGITFDGEFTKLPFPFSKFNLFIRIERILRAWVNTNRALHTKTTVCVDYNYYNWVKTLGIFKNKANLYVIPNYASSKISENEFQNKLNKQPNTPIKILFARRFVEHRGTIVFVNAIKKILEEFPTTIVTFAGSGPLKDFIQTSFKNDDRITITSYSPEESVKFHSQFDIAVVPTISSEGTSLSLLEAMAAGCFPIATHVGGLTNILLNGYNGILCAPNENAIYNALKEALLMPKKQFSTIQKNAYNSATTAFSRERWEKSWTEILSKCAN